MRLELPKQNNYETAFARAAEKLRDSDWPAVAGEAGASFRDGEFTLSYFRETCAVKVPEVEFRGAPIPLVEKILVLHYLTTFSGRGGRGTPVQFKNLPGGSFYQGTYRKRGPELILKKFGRDPGALLEAGKRLGGTPAEYGDASVSIPVFPRIRATVILHAGDEEFPPEASILYPDTIIHYLTLEDVALLAGMIYKRLKAAL